MWTLTNSGKLIEKIESKQDELTAWEWISIGNISMNARKWPCPEWFHVPTVSEWKWVKTIMDSLSLTTWDSWRINLHIPFTGNFNTEEESRLDKDISATLWMSTPSSNGWAKTLDMRSSTVYSLDDNPRPRDFWMPIRWFKDLFVTPTSSWTVIQWTLWSAWIFWNQSEWLISITNWTTGYTIMDKNLWATIVYNNWDTLTQDNMGNFYQWWNNYWFPSVWSFSKTSYTQVDASWYWPSTANGYYENDTFIIVVWDWSSVSNDDLWWDTTWTITQENVISNTGVLSVNGQTGDVTISAWSEIVYCTQAEYDALPSSKLTDGKSYVIYE